MLHGPVGRLDQVDVNIDEPVQSSVLIVEYEELSSSLPAPFPASKTTVPSAVKVPSWIFDRSKLTIDN